MSRFGVFRLMREASQRGHRLETIVGQCRDAIRQAENAFAYVRSLIALDKDWSYVERAAAESTERERVQSEAATELASRIAELEGCSFVGDDGLVRRVRAGVAAIYTEEEAAKTLGRTVGSRAVNEAFLRALEHGKLRVWQPSGMLH